MSEVWKRHIEVVMATILDDYGYTKVEIVNNRREKEAFEKKRRVSKALYSRDFTYEQIGWVMEKTHGAIYNQVNDGYREKRKEKSKRYWKGY